MVKVKLFGHTSSLAGTAELAVPSGPLRAVLGEVARYLPKDARRHLINEDSGEPEGVHLVLNGTSVVLPQALDLELKPGDSLSIISPVTGG